MKRTTKARVAGGTARETTPFIRPPVEVVSRRARDIWVARGHPQGCDDEIWYEAERQIAAETRAGMPPLEERGIRVPRDGAGLEARVDEVITHHSPPPGRASPTSLPP